MDEVCVESPSTVSNVVCGFDCLGFALDAPFDEMRLRKIEEREIRIIHRDGFGLPTDPAQNVAGVALQALMDAAECGFGFELEINKAIKPGSGIGSSAASACGAVVAANHLLGGKFTSLELIEFAMAGEMLASGSRHADNLAPCIYGGFTLVRSVNPLDIVGIAFPPLYATVIHPQIEIKTSEARALLPKQVSLVDAVSTWSNLASLVTGLFQADYDLMARSMQDTIVEPIRKKLIPKFDEVKAASLAAGALGGGISGSGPSIFMLSESEEMANDVAAAMGEVYDTTGLPFNIHVSQIAATGVRIAGA